MFLGNKEAVIIMWALKVLAPCVVAYLKSSQVPMIRDMDSGKKNALISLFSAVNGDDSEAKKAVKAAQEEVKKIQGGA